MKKCATAVSAVPKFENVLVFRTAHTAVARDHELFNGLLTRQRRVEVVKNRQDAKCARKNRENRCLPHAWQVDAKIPANSCRN